MAKRQRTIAEILKLLKTSGPTALTPTELRAARSLLRRKKTAATGGYDGMREEAHARRRAVARSGMDIAPLPEIADPKRRGRCRNSLRLFLETYLLPMFSDPDTGEHWPWSRDLLTAIKRLERAILHGDRFAIAMARGGGKTGLLTGAVIWASLNGYCPWVCVLAANGPKAEDFIADLQMILETNDLLAADFPEVCYPLIRLDRISSRQRGQTYMGRHTRITWHRRRIVLPDILGSRAAGARISAAGLDSRGVRGQKLVLPDGRQLRPSLVLIDDPQTVESAQSAHQCGKRLKLLSGDVLKMGPPGKPLAAMMAVTVIAENDMADQVIKDPRWRGLRTKMIDRWPINHKVLAPDGAECVDLWDRYGLLYRAGDDEGAAKLYAGHRGLKRCRARLDKRRACKSCKRQSRCMDAGAVVSWKERKYPADLSAVQHAMNLYFDSPAAFMAEMQQDPRPQIPDGSGRRLDPKALVRRISGLPRGALPSGAVYTTAFIDVHDKILYWMVCAWQQDFTGQIVDYGTYPQQPLAWFAQSNPPRPLSAEFPGLGREGVIVAGLERLGAELLARPFAYPGGAVHQLDSLFVDANFERKLVVAMKRKLASPSVWLRHGVGLTPNQRPISMYERRPGWIFGDAWFVGPVPAQGEFPHVTVEVNYWKTFCRDHLDLPSSDAGAITLFGRPGEEKLHEPLAAQLARSEYGQKKPGTYGDVTIWKAMPRNPDNHWWDCLVGCAVAASKCGCRPAGVPPPEERKRKRYTQADLSRSGGR